MKLQQKQSVDSGKTKSESTKTKNAETRARSLRAQNAETREKKKNGQNLHKFLIIHRKYVCKLGNQLALAGSIAFQNSIFSAFRDYQMEIFVEFCSFVPEMVEHTIESMVKMIAHVDSCSDSFRVGARHITITPNDAVEIQFIIMGVNHKWSKNHLMNTFISVLFSYLSNGMITALDCTYNMAFFIHAHQWCVSWRYALHKKKTHFFINDLVWIIARIKYVDLLFAGLTAKIRKVI